VYKSFVIAGLGTLGGFLADSLSRLDETEELTLIDFDTVEWKNLGTSIYRPIDVGVKKVTALTDIIIHQNPGVVVKSIDDTFIEGETKIPEGDIVFDCRDIICDRKDIIDVRVSISSRYVIVDCRKNVSYKEQKDGRYLVDLRKDDIRNAAFIVSMLVSNQTIRQLIKTQSIQKYELDYLKKIEPKYGEVVYECAAEAQQIVNLPTNIIPIIEENRKRDIEVFVGSQEQPISQTKIPQNTLKTGYDVVSSLTSLLTLPCEYPSYLISLHNHGYIVLIPETGAA
jgi:hypothetical protein